MWSAVQHLWNEEFDYCWYENWRAPPPLMWWISIFLYLVIRGLLFLTILCLSFCSRRKIERFLFFSKKKSEMVENWNISESRGGRKFFLKLCQSLNFYQISKRKGPNCSEEQSPYRKNNKRVIPPKINKIFGIFTPSISDFFSLQICCIHGFKGN